jgi:DNA polymerase III delta prime subunit
MKLNINQKIMEKLRYFHEIHKIPNIIFHGQTGCGKKTIVNDFINLIYNNDKEKIKNLVMYVNCAYGKGIKFIREELKFFAKTNIHCNGGDLFKTIILLNADKLTIDAQSALRRCIELFSHNTRFFIIIEDKSKLLKPIISRFCEIYIPQPMYKNVNINLYKYNLNETFKLENLQKRRIDVLKKDIMKLKEIEKLSYKDLFELSIKLYENAYSSLDLIELIENDKEDILSSIEKKYELLFVINKIRKELRNEKTILLIMLNFMFLDKTYCLEKISLYL